MKNSGKYRLGHQYYKVIRVFICMYVCMYVCLKLNNSGTAGPIWLSLFLLAPSWSRDGFRLKKNPDPGSGFSENPKKPILAGNYKIFLQKIFEFSCGKSPK